MDGLWIYRLLVTGLAVSWIVASHSGFRVFRQKLTPEYRPLPGLIRRHVNVGLAWAFLLALTGLASLVRSGAGVPESGFSLITPLVLGLVSLAVVYTGYGLKIGKPSGVWVHVSLVLISTALGLVLLLKYLWNGLS